MQSTPSLRGYVLKCWVFPRRECRFPTTFAALDSSITVRLIRLEEHSLFLYLDACDATGTFIDGPRIPVPSQSNVRFIHTQLAVYCNSDNLLRLLLISRSRPMGAFLA